MPPHDTVLTIPRPGEVRLVDRACPRIVPGCVLVKTAIAPVCIEHQIHRDHTFEEDSNDSGHCLYPREDGPPEAPAPRAQGRRP